MTCARTVATLVSPITSLRFSTTRTATALPYPMKPAALLFHSWNRIINRILQRCRRGMVVLRTRKINPSSEVIFAPHAFVCDLLYCLIMGGTPAQHSVRMVGYSAVTFRLTDTVNLVCNGPVWEFVPASRYAKIAQCSAQQAGSVPLNAAV